MKSPALILLATALITLALGGCQEPPPPMDEAAIFGVVQENLRAMEQRNTAAVMATIHPKAPAYESTREVIQTMFEEVDLKYALSDLKLVSATSEEARVSFVQRMEKTGGTGEFVNHIVHGVHLLRPDHGKWKIHGTRQTKVTDLEGSPLAAPTEQEPEPSKPQPATPAETTPSATPPAAGGNPAPSAGD